MIRAALTVQAAAIIQNPDSGLTYSPARARLLTLLAGVLPDGLARVSSPTVGGGQREGMVENSLSKIVR